MRILDVKKVIAELVLALQWTSRSSDFVPEGLSREEGINLCELVIENGLAVLTAMLDGQIICIED